MTFSQLISMCLCVTFITACSSASGVGPKPSFGMVVVSELERGSAVKNGVHATTDTGRYLFAPSRMSGSGKQNGTFVGGSVPRWVRVTWREGNIVQATKGGWEGGTVVGDNTIEVASRIPAEVMKYASEVKGRAIRLVFRVKDDVVLLAWSVQEQASLPGTTATARWHSFRGGDFGCSTDSSVNCTTGTPENAPWFSPNVIRGRSSRSSIRIVSSPPTVAQAVQQPITQPL